jgi:hypothetical protein
MKMGVPSCSQNRANPKYFQENVDFHLASVPKHVACEEDDEFVALFDKMLNENIAESRNVSTRGDQCYKTFFFFVTDALY